MYEASTCSRGKKSFLYPGYHNKENARHETEIRKISMQLEKSDMDRIFAFQVGEFGPLIIKLKLTGVTDI